MVRLDLFCRIHKESQVRKEDIMAENASNKHYEEEFEFPLWKLIKQRAKEKDISYVAACREVVPEYQKTIKYKDTGWTNEQILKRNREMAELKERDNKQTVGG
jgi:hypothetical protein